MNSGAVKTKMVWNGMEPYFWCEEKMANIFFAGERANQEFDGSLPVISIKNLHFMLFYLNISITQIEILEKATWEVL